MLNGYSIQSILYSYTVKTDEWYEISNGSVLLLKAITQPQLWTAVLEYYGEVGVPDSQLSVQSWGPT
jgi:hypothetical protein